MPYSRPLLVVGLCDWTATPEASRPVSAWTVDPALSQCASPADAVTRAASDPALFGSLAARTGDRLATTAALAVVAERLRPIVMRWRRAGLSGEDLSDAEADLVAEALVAMRADPSRPPAEIAQVAWHRVEAIRRTGRARADRQVPLSPAHEAPAAQSGLRPLGLIGDAVAAGVLTAATAAALWAECGLATMDLGSCSPVAWRQRRSRARRALRAALGSTEGL